MPQENTAKKWLKLTIACPIAIVEPASDLMGVLSGSGVEIRPPADIDIDTQEISGFFALNGGPQSAAEIVRRVTAEMEELFAIYNLVMPAPATELFDDQDWATSWQQFFSSFEIIPGLVIRPSWEKYTPRQGQQVLTMDPGMAFGTGQHASTRMALSLLASCFTDNKTAPRRMLDVGTGTGILAMAGALFGADQVMAVDNDPQAVEIAGHNIRANHLDLNIGVSGLPLADIQGSYDLICANIVHDVLVEMAPAIKKLLAEGGKVVLSGILSGWQEQNIEKVYGAVGLKTLDRQHQEEWAALLLG
jgi:ribosomal protein L11 methyltransferase